MKRQLLAVNLFIALALILTACAPVDTAPAATAMQEPPTERQYGGTLNFWQPSWDGSKDWFHHIKRDEVTTWMWEELFWTTTGSFIPVLATGYDVSDDGLVYTVHLREGVKFHDGEDFTAEDVKYSFELKYDPGILPPEALKAEAERVEGLFAYKQGEEGADEITGIRIVDDYTVEFVLTDPDPSFFPGFLGYVEHPMMPKHVLETLDRDELVAGTSDYWVTGPIGTGPYQFVEHVPGQYVEYARFDDYWGGKPGPERVFVKFAPIETAIIMLEKGELDIVWEAPAEEAVRLQDNPDIDVLVADNVMGFWIQTPNWHAGDGLWQNPKAKRAMLHAADRQGYVDNVMHGLGVVRHSWFHGTPFECPDLVEYEYDLDKAKALLDEIGMTADKRADYNLSLTVYPGNKMRVDYAVMLHEAYTQLGFKTNVDLIDAASWADYRNGRGPRGTEFDFAIANWGPGTNPYVLEPYMVGTVDLGYWPLDVERDYHWNEYSANAEEAADLWGKIFAETDIEAQKPYFQQLDCILNEEVFIPHLIGESWIALKSKRLQGIDLDLNVSVYIVPMMVDMANWWIWDPDADSQ